MIQDWADNFREWRATWHQGKARHHLTRRDDWRAQLLQPWQDLVPGWTLVIATLAAGVAVWWAL